MLGVYNYTVVLTYVGMLSGFLGILSALRGDLHTALLCLMIAGGCDMFDGTVAGTRERTQREKRFGVQIDSLSDLICFGVLPGVICYVAALESRLSLVIACVYVLCALIRLAWFNVDEEERQNNEAGPRQVYLGMPVTLAAIIVPLLMEAVSLLGGPMKWAMPILLLLMAAAFLTPFSLKKPGMAGKLVMAAVGAAVLAVLLMRVAL